MSFGCSSSANEPIQGILSSATPASPATQFSGDHFFLESAKETQKHLCELLQKFRPKDMAQHDLVCEISNNANNVLAMLNCCNFCVPDPLLLNAPLTQLSSNVSPNPLTLNVDLPLSFDNAAPMFPGTDTLITGWEESCKSAPEETISFERGPEGRFKTQQSNQSVSNGVMALSTIQHNMFTTPIFSSMPTAPGLVTLAQLGLFKAVYIYDAPKEASGFKMLIETCDDLEEKLASINLERSLMELHICQPPVTKLTAHPGCPCSCFIATGPGRNYHHFQSICKTISYENGCRVGDLFMLIENVVRSHWYCPFATPGMGEQDGTTKTSVRIMSGCLPRTNAQNPLCFCREHEPAPQEIN